MQWYTLAALRTTLLLLANLVVSDSSSGVGVNWIDAETLSVKQRGPWGGFVRLPPAANSTVRQAVWELSRHSAGIAVHFELQGAGCATGDGDGTITLLISTVYTGAGLDMPHMPATGMSGFDLYAVDAAVVGGLRWLANWVPSAFGDYTTVPANGTLASGLDPTLRRFALYLPLYNGVQLLRLATATSTATATAVDKSKCNIVPVPVAGGDDGGGGILFYGTSVTQGGVVSRPGQAFTNILSRTLKMPVYNFGFSGNGEMEINVTRHLLLVPNISAFIVDCNGNMCVHPT